MSSNLSESDLTIQEKQEKENGNVKKIKFCP